MEAARLNCLRCRHFHVTWDPALPRGCRAHGFKSAELPSQLVQRSSGMACQLYEAKPEASGDAVASEDRGPVRRD